MSDATKSLRGSSAEADVGLDILSAGVYDSISHFNFGEKAALDAMNFFNIDPGVHMMNKLCRVVNTSRQRSSVYRMSQSQKT